MATKNLTTADFQSAIDAEGITLIDFWADWCGPCKQFAPVYERVSEKHDDVTFAKIDTEAEQALAAQLGITAIPTLMAFRDGVLVFNQAGALGSADLEKLVDSVKALDMEEVHRQIEAQKSN